MIERLKKNLPMVGVVIAFLIGTAVGPGAFWQWQPHVLDKVVKTTELRKQENDLYSKIIEISEEYGKNMDRHEMYAAKARKTNSEINADRGVTNKMLRLKPQLDLLKDNFTALEAKLSPIEGRPPRRINLEFIPPPRPDQLTVSVF